MIEMVMFFTAGMAVGSLLNLIITKWAEYARLRRIMAFSNVEIMKIVEELKARREESE